VAVAVAVGRRGEEIPNPRRPTPNAQHRSPQPGTLKTAEWRSGEKREPIKGYNVTIGEGGQATMGDGWMPWGQEPKKGAAHGETLRGAASTLGSGDTRMGQPHSRDGE
jgi:hypothetical protein